MTSASGALEGALQVGGYRWAAGRRRACAATQRLVTLAGERQGRVAGFGRLRFADEREEVVEGLVAAQRGDRRERRTAEPPRGCLRVPVAQKRKGLREPRLAQRLGRAEGPVRPGAATRRRGLEQAADEGQRGTRVEVQQGEQALAYDPRLFVSGYSLVAEQGCGRNPPVRGDRPCRRDARRRL